MSFQLKATRALYQTSKYAPAAVIQLELATPTKESFSSSKTQIDKGLFQLSASSSGGPLSLPGEGTPIETYCTLMLELQRYAGHSVSYSRVQAPEANQDHRVFVEYEDAATALYASELAVELLNTLPEILGSDNLKPMSALKERLVHYVDFALRRCPDPNTRLLVQAAIRQDIPVVKPDHHWLVPTRSQLTNRSEKIQYGWGVNQRHCEASLPLDFSPRESLAQISDRAHLLERFTNASIPIAGQDLEFINRNTVKRAQRSARRIGYPVTLQPRVSKSAQYRDHENHSFGPLTCDTDVALVVNYLTEQAGEDVWIESWLEGTHYRFLVLNNKVVCVVRCAPPVLTGNGIHNIAELARRRAAAAPDSILYRAWHKIAEGEAGVACRLRLAGLSLESIPGPGERIAMRDSGTIYNDGLCEIVTEHMPSHFGKLALQASGIAGLEHLAAVQMNIADLSGTTEMPNCAVIGVDPAPDLREFGLSPEGDPYRVGETYMALLFPTGHPSRIPIAAVTGTNGKTTTSRMVNEILSEAGLKTGLACTDGVYVEDKLCQEGDLPGVQRANMLFKNPQIDAVVLETARGGMAKRGIAFDHCDVGACLNIASDHLGLAGINTLDEMAVHKRQVIERATGVAVLNAEDSRCLAMQEHTSADEVILFACSADLPSISAHCQAGGRAIVTIPANKSSVIGIKDSSGVAPLLDVNQIPATFGGKARFNVENAMAAIAISVGLGISNDVIVKALTGFRASFEKTPGRMNVYDGLPFRVIVDWAHNVHGFKAFFQFFNQLQVSGKRIVVISEDGRKNDDEIRAYTSMFAHVFDHFICHNTWDNPHLRGRKKGTLTAQLTSALAAHSVAKEKIEVIPDPEEAVDRALAIAMPGDIVVIFYGEDSWERFTNLTGPELVADYASLPSILDDEESLE